VKVLSVDIPRKRISLTMRLDDPADGGATGGRPAGGSRQDRPRTDRGDSQPSRSPGRGGDRRGGEDRRDGGDRGRGGDRRDGGPRGGRGAATPPGGAMAEALRKAGLVGDSGAAGKPGGKPRRGDGRR
jgi:protein Tex